MSAEVTQIITPQQEEIQKRRDNAIDTQMSTGIGREFIAMFLEDHYWCENPFSGNHGQLSYNTGYQQAGNDLYQLVDKRQPEQTAMMLKEWRERRDNIDEEHDDG